MCFIMPACRAAFLAAEELHCRIRLSRGWVWLARLSIGWKVELDFSENADLFSLVLLSLIFCLLLPNFLSW